MSNELLKKLQDSQIKIKQKLKNNLNINFQTIDTLHTFVKV